jgi:hypothetical protein
VLEQWEITTLVEENEYPGRAFTPFFVSLKDLISA